MEHALVASIEKALGWEGAAPLGRNFARAACPILGSALDCSRPLGCSMS